MILVNSIPRLHTHPGDEFFSMPSVLPKFVLSFQLRGSLPISDQLGQLRVTVASQELYRIRIARHGAEN